MSILYIKNKNKMFQELITDLLSFSSSIGWMIIAISGYFIMAAVSVFDKFLLHSRISKPAVYAFYVAFFSLFVLAFIPISIISPQVGVILLPSIKILSLALISGFFFIYSLLSLYKAVQENEISRVAPLVGSIIPLVSVIYAYIFLGERLGVLGFFAVMVLVAGGFLVSFDLPINNLKLFKGFKYSVVAAICQAISFGLVKEVFENTEFLNGFFWNRVGFFLAGLSILIFPVYRKQVVSSFKSGKKSTKKAASTSMLFTVNKVMAGVGSFLIVLAISKGAVTSVNSVGSSQFAFVLIIASLLSMKYHDIFNEKLSRSDWVQKIIAVILIALGLWMLSIASPGAFSLSS